MCETVLQCKCEIFCKVLIRLKDTICQALKLYANTWLAGIMGAFLYLSLGVIFSMLKTTGFVMNLVALILQSILFALIVYTKMWDLGDKNANAANFGHMTADPLRGLKLGLLAAIPSILTFLVLIADKLFGFWSGVATAYRICHTALYPVIVWSMGSLVSLTTAEISWGGIFCAGLPLLFMPVVATLAYYSGYRHISLREKIVFVNKEK